MYRILSELLSEGAPSNVQQTRLSLLSCEKRMLTVQADRQMQVLSPLPGNHASYCDRCGAMKRYGTTRGKHSLPLFVIQSSHAKWQAGWQQLVPFPRPGNHTKSCESCGAMQTLHCRGTSRHAAQCAQHTHFLFPAYSQWQAGRQLPVLSPQLGHHTS